ncbi:TolC family protein, partial [Burkholderia sp. LMG 13014]
MSAAFRLSALAMSVTLAACAVGPDFKRPDTATTARFARDAHPASPRDTSSSDTTANTPPDASADADAAFWRGFGDPTLTQLIDSALAANQDLRVAVSRYDASNALLSQATFDRYPTITASGQIGHQLMSKDQAFGAPRSQRDTPTSSVGINAAWELDLFGRVRRSIESQRAETAASAADVRAVRVAIAGEVASTYVDLRGSQ